VVTDEAKAVVNSFVISIRVDYCNSLLTGAPRYQLDRLQSVPNTVAGLFIGTKDNSIRHVLRDCLHWLPVQQRVQFKLSADI